MGETAVPCDEQPGRDLLSDIERLRMRDKTLEEQGAEPGQTRVRPWASLAYRDYRLMWAGGFGSGTAMSMRQVVNLWLVFQLTGSAVQLGLTGLFQAIPMLFLGVFAGALADVFNKKKLLFLVQASGMLTAVALATLSYTDTLRVWHIFAFTSLSSTAMMVGGPARISMTSRLVPQSHVMNALTLNTALGQAAFFVGPVMAGFLLEWVGPGTTFLVNAFLFVPGLIALILVRTSGAPEGPRQGVSLRVVFEGAQFVWRERILLPLFLMDFGVVVVGFYRTLLPILAEDVFHVGPAALGILFAAPAVGSILGFGAILVAGEVKRKGALFLLAVLLYAGSLAWLGASSAFWMALLAAGALGFTDSLNFAVRITLTQTLAPDRLRGRAASYSMIFGGLADALGAMEAGFVAGAIGASATLLIGGAAATGMVIGGSLTWRHVWRHRSGGYS